MKKNYLAIILIATGSSYARGPDLEDCVSRVQRIFVSDWSSLFEVKGKEATVGLYDVTDQGDLYWDHRGVFATVDGKETEVPLLEARKVTLPKR